MKLKEFKKAVSEAGFDPDDISVVRLFAEITQIIGRKRVIDTDEMESVMKREYKKKRSKSDRPVKQGPDRATLLANLAKGMPYVEKLPLRINRLKLAEEMELNEIRRNEIQIKRQRLEAILATKAVKLKSLESKVRQEQDKHLKPPKN